MSKWADLPRWDGRSPALRAKQEAMVRSARVEQSNADAVATVASRPAENKPYEVEQGELDSVGRANRAAALTLPAFARPIFRDVATEYGLNLREVVSRNVRNGAAAARHEAITQCLRARPDISLERMALLLPFAESTVWRAASEAKKRDIEGASNLTGRSRTLLASMPDFAREIVRRITAEHNCTVQELLGVRKTARLVEARDAAIVQVRRARPTYSLHQIARLFGKDHTTILHSLRKSGFNEVRGAA